MDSTNDYAILLNEKCSCLSISDFVCNCKGKFQSYCYSHAKSHFQHNDIKFVPNLKTIQKIPQIVDVLKERLEILKQYKEHANLVASLCIENINKALKNAQSRFDHMISNLLQVQLIMQDENINKPVDYLGIHNYFFADSLVNLKVLFRFRVNSSHFEKYCKKLFEIDDYTEMLVKPFGKSPLDEVFYEKELNRIANATIIKNAKKLNNQDQFLKTIYSGVKSRGSNMGVLFGEITSNDMLNNICAFSRIIEKPRILSITNCKYSDNKFEKVIQIINNYQKISPDLILSDSMNSESQVEMTMIALQRYKSVVNLNFSNNYFGPFGMQNLSNALMGFYKILYLNLNGNFLTETGAKILSNSLKYVPTLISLSLDNNQFGPTGGIYLQDGLLELKRLESLSIQLNDLQARGISSILEAISIMPHICRLNICMNDIDDEGGLILSNYLCGMKCLSYLVIDLVLSNDVKALICSATSDFCKVICRNTDNRVVLKTGLIQGSHD